MGDRPQVWFPLIGPGIFTQDGEEWKHSRNLLRPFFQSKRNDNFLEVQESVSVLLESIPSGRVVDFQPLFFRFTLDTTTYLLFGRPIRSLGDSNEEAEAFGESFRVSQYYLSQRGHLGPLHWLCNPKSFKDANRTVHRWIDREIKTVLETYKNDPSKDKDTKNSYGYLGALMAETQEPKELRDALLNILLAGRDTTACMLTWMMRLLVKHQDVLKKLREEIENIVGVGEEGRDPDRNDLKKMLYLSYVCKEGILSSSSTPCTFLCCISILSKSLLRDPKSFDSTRPFPSTPEQLSKRLFSPQVVGRMAPLLSTSRKEQQLVGPCTPCIAVLIYMAATLRPFDLSDGTPTLIMKLT
jgi:cytochrome P450